MKNPFRTERLLLRAIKDTPADAAFIHAVQDDPEAYALSNMGLLKPESDKASAEWKAYLTEQCLLGVIVCIAPPTADHQETTTQVPIGIISLSGARPGHAHHRNSYISIDIIAAHQRKGYGSEAMAWVLAWGFRTAGLHRIGVECFSYNTGASRLYERQGFVLEGRKREAVWFDGQWHDVLTYSMLEHEWRARHSDG